VSSGPGGVYGLKHFTLYGTSACHLCELAEAVIAEQLGCGGVSVEAVDISGSDELLARYGVVIPVLRHPDGRELRWPFDSLAASEFLAS